jgi:YfiH family protein
VSASGFFIPDWPAPDSVRAIQTTRGGGCSEGSYESFNLGDHVGDDPLNVARNREQLLEVAALPSQPAWLQQVHGVSIVQAGDFASPPEADVAWSDERGVVCTVLTADCLPLLVCDRTGSHVAAVHSGWRGMSAGVIESAIGQLFKRGVKADDLLVWLGPAIGPDAYEIDAPVYDAFLAREPACETAFKVSRPGHWHLDLYKAARILLARTGVQAVYGGNYCTHSDEQFFSHRREAPCGRQASLIWLQ